MADDDEQLLTAADDGFHHAPEGAWWFHETCWFWFHVPERALGGWLYGWVRPNIGVCGGGCQVWDDSTFVHWEAPYFSDHHNLRPPAEADLRDIAFPTGLRVRVEEPLRRYAVGYRDEGLIDLSLTFDAVMAPWVSTEPAEDGGRRPRHLDQFGRVTGQLELLGERLDVDCLAIRDRTWALRSERWRHGGGYGYTSAAAPSGESFLVVGDDHAVSGFVQLDGIRHGLVAGSRRVKRNTEHGYPERVMVMATDTAGRALEAEGVCISRIAMPVPGVQGMVWASLTSWTINGVAAWGDDQEPWPIHQWAARRRAWRSSRPG